MAQLCSYCKADLHLCFRLCRLLVFPCCGSYSKQFLILEFTELLNPEHKFSPDHSGEPDIVVYIETPPDKLITEDVEPDKQSMILNGTLGLCCTWHDGVSVQSTKFW